MIKIETEWNKKNNEVHIDYEHEKSCAIEHIALLKRLFDEIKKNTGLTHEGIFDLVKELEVEDKDEK